VINRVALGQNIFPLFGKTYPSCMTCDRRKISVLLSNLARRSKFVDALFEERKEKLKAGDELPPGSSKLVKFILPLKGTVRRG